MMAEEIFSLSFYADDLIIAMPRLLDWPSSYGLSAKGGEERKEWETCHIHSSFSGGHEVNDFDEYP